MRSIHTRTLSISLVSRVVAGLLLAGLIVWELHAASTPERTRHSMVASQNEVASRVGADVMREGGNAIDAAVATAFALAVTHPTAGNIGGGGFLVFRPAAGEPVAYDFRETAPAKASAAMFLKDGKHDFQYHHFSHAAVGVPGTVAGLHLAWKEQGRLPWKRLVQPAVKLAREGFVVTDGLAGSLKGEWPLFRKHPATWAQFTRNGIAYEAGDMLKQPDLARTLDRIAREGPAGFYAGETARLIEREMRAHDGLITREDLSGYQAKRRVPVRGVYRGYEVISMPPPSSGGTAIIEVLNQLEGYDLGRQGAGSAQGIHWITEALRRAFADRARYLGDPDFNADLPLSRLLSKEHATSLRKGIRDDRASVSSPDTFAWPYESAETTHFSVVDKDRNAVALTYTLEYGYGSGIVVPGAGFLLNNEMGDFNAGPGLTTKEGLIGTPPNLAAPRKRMLSSMSPTIMAKDGKLVLVTGSPGGRTIISTTLLTILNIVDFGMNVQEAVDAPRFHHQWLPDQLVHERRGLSPDTLRLLQQRGHKLAPIDSQGAAEAILVNGQDGWLEAGVDRRAPDGGAAGW